MTIQVEITKHREHLDSGSFCEPRHHASGSKSRSSVDFGNAQQMFKKLFGLWQVDSKFALAFAEPLTNLDSMFHCT